MKKSINAWSVPDLYTFEETLRSAKKAGFDAVEFNLDGDAPGKAHAFHMNTPDENILKVRELAEEIGIDIASISSSLHNGIWAQTGISEVTYAREVLRKQLHIAKLIGTDGILVVPGGMRGGMLLNEARRNSIKNLKAMESEIRESGIKVGLENVWNGFFLSPYDMKSFLCELDSDVFGAYLDIGNMIAFSDPEYWADVIGEYVVKLHIKGYKRNGGINSGGSWCSLLAGDGNWKRTLPILKEKGFDGYLTAEVASGAPGMTDEQYLKFIADEEAEIIGYLN